MKILQTLLLISITLLNNHEKVTKKPIEDSKLQVYLFAGQSNMDGRANGADLTDEDLKRLEKVANRIQFYFNHKPVSPLQLSSATKFIENKFGSSKIFGPELFFGIEMAEKHPDKKFIFIKKSRGGTSLYGTWNPNWTEEKAKQMKEEKLPKLFFEFKDYIKEVLKKYEPNSYEIKGVLWVQGEADSNKKNYGDEPGDTYAQNLKELITSIRTEFSKPELPFAMFQVGKGKVVEGMKKVAKEDNNVYLIEQSDDENSADFYPQYPKPMGHYTTESMKRIGTNFSKIFENL